MVVSLALLGLALKGLPLGTAYAVWTGVGTIGTVILGIALFGESAIETPTRLHCAHRCRHRRPQADLAPLSSRLPSRRPRVLLVTDGCRTSRSPDRVAAIDDSSDPVMALDASLARNRIAEAISSARATRFIGVFSIQTGNSVWSVKPPRDITVST